MTIIVLALYCILIVFFIYGWKKQKSSIQNSISSSTTCSIVIAARNEATTLPLLLTDLVAQNYDMQQVQIVIVDDHSTDQTIAQIKQFATKLPIEILQLENNQQGKKAAIARGIAACKHQTLVFIDADCRVGTLWLASMINCFEQQKGGLICGPVQFDSNKKSCWQIILEIEFSLLVSSGAAMAALKRPIFCNAANMMVSKEDYIESQKYIEENGSSGDDVFLLQHLKQKKRNISFCKSTQAIVYTAAPSTPKAFIQQRLRWAAKSRRYKDADSIIVSILVLLANVWPLFLLACLSLSITNWQSCILFYAIKTIFDMLFFLCFSSFFNLKKRFWLIAILPFFYSIYVLIVSSLMLVYRPQWKGRKISV